MLVSKKTDRKFRFLEDFPEYEESELRKYASSLAAGEEDEEEEDGSSEGELTETEFFGKVRLRQIARVEWAERTVEREVEKTDPITKRTKTEIERVKMYEEVVGELGGWLEMESNLSQEGDCWVDQQSRVLGNARVYGDAEIKGGAEIGDSARVGDKVKIKGPIGIGGNARILDTSEVKGKKRLAVFGSAEITGNAFVGDEAKVYGDAKVSGQVGYSVKRAYVKGRARVYGRAVVRGTVADNAEVYGRASVFGTVDEDAQVGGTAQVGSTGHVFGKVVLLRGEVSGSLRGEGEIAWPQFTLSGTSNMVMKPFEESDEESVEAETEEEKDKIEDRKVKAYKGEVASVSIKGTSSIVDCEFKGNVSVHTCSMDECKAEDSVLGGETTLYASKSDFKGSMVYGGSVMKSSLEYCHISRNGQSRYITVVGSRLEGVATGSNCRRIEGCKLKDMTVDSGYVVGENMSDGVLKETAHGNLWNIYFIEDDDFRMLVRPDEYGKILWYCRGAEKLDGIYFYVYKYMGRHEYLYDMAEQRFGDELDEKARKLREKRLEIEQERREWFNGILSGIWAKYKELDEATPRDWEGAASAKRLYEFVKMFSSLDFYNMSANSYARVQSEILLTVKSFDGKTFTPHSDFGVLEVDKSIEDLAAEYRTNRYLT